MSEYCVRISRRPLSRSPGLVDGVPAFGDCAYGNTVAVHRLLIVGPTSASWGDAAEEVTVDLEPLRRPGLELSYRCIGAGRRAIRSDADVVAAVPHVVQVAVATAKEGFGAVIVDCTDDPGDAAARRSADITVIGAGEALRWAIAEALGPARLFSGDELRQLTTDERDTTRIKRQLPECDHTVQWPGENSVWLTPKMCSARANDGERWR